MLNWRSSLQLQRSK
ncbi:hypothetical protein LINGRAHAP2_LOCUS21230 [Linum grandiflorum]